MFRMIKMQRVKLNICVKKYFQLFTETREMQRENHLLRRNCLDRFNIAIYYKYLKYISRVTCQAGDQLYMNFQFHNDEY